MKTITYINRILLITNIFLFVTIPMFGFMFQILLGLSQMLTLIILINSSKKPIVSRNKKLRIYITCLLLYIMIIALNYGNNSEQMHSAIFLLAISPMSLAFYFTIILEENLKKQRQWKQL